MKNGSVDIDFKEPGLQEYEKEIIRGIGSRVEYKKGQVISSPGDNTGEIYLIESGLVKFYRLDGEGRRISLGCIKKPGDLLGLAEAFCDIERTCYTGAVDDVVLISVEKKDFQDLLDCDPFFFRKILHMISSGLRQNETRIYGITFNQAQGVKIV